MLATEVFFKRKIIVSLLSYNIKNYILFIKKSNHYIE